MGKPLDPHKKKRTMKRWTSLLPATVVSSCEPVAAVECLFNRSYALKIIGQARFIFISGINGSTLLSFTGLSSHPVWLNLFGYRYISLDTQELYHLTSLIGFGMGQASLIFGWLLTGVIDRLSSFDAQVSLSGEYSTLLVGQVVISGDPDWRYIFLSSRLIVLDKHYVWSSYYWTVIIHASMFSGMTGWLLLWHTTWNEQCSHLIIHTYWSCFAWLDTCCLMIII